MPDAISDSAKRQGFRRLVACLDWQSIVSSHRIAERITGILVATRTILKGAFSAGEPTRKIDPKRTWRVSVGRQASCITRRGRRSLPSCTRYTSLPCAATSCTCVVCNGFGLLFMLRVYHASDGARCCLRVDFEPLADAMFSASVQPAFPFALWGYAKGVRAPYSLKVPIAPHCAELTTWREQKFDRAARAPAHAHAPEGGRLC
jgi:hypothetical protein